MKINRNDPCPCKSGLKYKKCCLLKEQDEAQVRIIRQREEDQQAFESAKKEYREGKGLLGEIFEDDEDDEPDPEYDAWFKKDEEEGRRNLEAYEAELKSRGVK